MRVSAAAIATISCLTFVTSSIAETVATIDTGQFFESGTITNLRSPVLTSFVIDLGVDDGSGITPIFGDGAVPIPAPIFSNAVPGAANSFFTASYLGLSVPENGTFVFGGLDYDSFNGSSGDPAFPTFDGSETLELHWSDGLLARILIPAGRVDEVAEQIVFDSEQLRAIPVPASFFFFGFGVLGLAAIRRLQRTTLSV